MASSSNSQGGRRGRRGNRGQEQSMHRFEETWLHLSQNPDPNTEYSYDPNYVAPTFNTEVPYYPQMTTEQAYQAQIPPSDADLAHQAFQAFS